MPATLDIEAIRESLYGLKTFLDALEDFRDGINSSYPPSRKTFREHADKVLESIPAKVERRDGTLGRLLEGARVAAEAVRAKCEAPPDLDDDEKFVWDNDPAESRLAANRYLRPIGAAMEACYVHPEDSQAKGGAEPKLKHALDFVEDYKANNPGASDEDSLAQYRRRYPKRGRGIQKVRQIRDARRYWRNQNH